MYYSTKKKLGSKNQKNLFAEGLAWPSAKGVFAEGLANRPRQRIFKKKIFAECLTAGTRQKLTPVAAVTHPAIFAEGQFAEG